MFDDITVINVIIPSSSIYLQTAGPHVDPTGLPQVADVPHSLTNGNHAVPSTAQPPLNQSGPGRPSATGTGCDFSSLTQLISRRMCIYDI